MLMRRNVIGFQVSVKRGGVGIGGVLNGSDWRNSSSGLWKVFCTGLHGEAVLLHDAAEWRAWRMRCAGRSSKNGCMNSHMWARRAQLSVEDSEWLGRCLKRPGVERAYARQVVVESVGWTDRAC